MDDDDREMAEIDRQLAALYDQQDKMLTYQRTLEGEAKAGSPYGARLAEAHQKSYDRLLSKIGELQRQYGELHQRQAEKGSRN